MLTYPQLKVRMDYVFPPYATIKIIINENSIAALEQQLDVLDDLIVRHGTWAFFGEPTAEPQRRIS